MHSPASSSAISCPALAKLRMPPESACLDVHQMVAACIGSAQLRHAPLGHDQRGAGLGA